MWNGTGRIRRVSKIAGASRRKRRPSRGNDCGSIAWAKSVREEACRFTAVTDEESITTRPVEGDIHPCRLQTTALQVSFLQASEYSVYSITVSSRRSSAVNCRFDCATSTSLWTFIYKKKKKNTEK